MSSIILLDPSDLDTTIEQLEKSYRLSESTLMILRRVMAILPCSARLYLDEANAELVQDLPLIDKFTFDLESDDLILYSLDPDTIIDALIEMAMYLTGFATMIGNEEIWVTEFTAGAWKPVKKQIKRHLDIPVREQPRAVVGLPADKDGGEPYPFQAMVASYNADSFHQMITLAARDDVAVYFPPETHSKVLATYVYARRAMQEVAQGLGIDSHQEFNERLLQAIQRIHSLFSPETLPVSSPSYRPPTSNDDPFEAFINELFADDDEQDAL
jgi:hypothetical protein